MQEVTSAWLAAQALGERTSWHAVQRACGRRSMTTTLRNPHACLAPLVVPQLEAENVELDRVRVLSRLGHRLHHELFVSDDGSTRVAGVSLLPEADRDADDLSPRNRFTRP